MSQPPLQPLRAVEVEVEPGPGRGRIVLRERDDYTVDYVNRKLRLRLAPDRAVRVQYFTLHPLDVLTSSRLRIDRRLDVFATDAPGAANVDALAASAIGSATAPTPRPSMACPATAV